MAMNSTAPALPSAHGVLVLHEAEMEQKWIIYSTSKIPRAAREREGCGQNSSGWESE